MDDPARSSQPRQEKNAAREEIALRAYRLWEERGRPSGTPQQDWLRAEAEMRSPSTQPVGVLFGMPEGWSWSQIEQVTKVGAVLAAAVYAVGFLVISAYDSYFGIVEFDFLRSRLVAAGILCLFFVAVLSLVAIGLPVKFTTFFSGRASSKLFDLCFGTTVTLYLTYILFAGNNFESAFAILKAAALPIIAGLASPRLLDARRFWLVDIVLYVCSIIIVVVDIRFASDGIRGVLLWLFFVSFLLWICPSSFATVKERPAFYTHIILIPSVAALAGFGPLVYRCINVSVGGGVPSPVTICTHSSQEQRRSRQVTAALIDETDRGCYVLVPESSKRATFIPRELVSALYFGHESKSDVCNLTSGADSAAEQTSSGPKNSPTERPAATTAKPLVRPSMMSVGCSGAMQRWASAFIC